MLRPGGSRGAVLATAAAALAALAFGAGFLAGAQRSAHRATSPLDQAEQALLVHADRQVSRAALTNAAIQAMVASLDDRWATYVSPGATAGHSSVTQVLTGHYSGVGLWLAGRDGEVVVSGVVAGSPAARVRLTPGESLVSVAGRPASLIGVAGAVAMLRGVAGTAVPLVVRTTPAGTERSVTLVRQTLADGAVSIDSAAPGYLRIAISSFSAGVGSQVAAIVKDAERHHVKGIVLDLRGNPGGLLSEGLAVASVFLDGGPVVSLTGRHIPAEVLDAALGGDVRTPLAVLVNGGTASAAEVVAAALQQRGRAVVVGSRTFGKGSVQQLIPLSNGGVIEVTVASYRTPDGSDLNGIGLAPDVAVAASAPPQRAVATAVAVLRGLGGTVQVAPAAAMGR